MRIHLLKSNNLPIHEINVSCESEENGFLTKILGGGVIFFNLSTLTVNTCNPKINFQILHMILVFMDVIFLDKINSILSKHV